MLKTKTQNQPMTQTQSDQHLATMEQIQLCCSILDAKKAEDVRVLHLGENSSLADYFIVASGTSEPHLRALVKSLDEALRREGIDVVRVESNPESGWVVLDLFDCVIHLFSPEKRNYYSLEYMWKDASEMDASELLSA